MSSPGYLKTIQRPSVKKSVLLSLYARKKLFHGTSSVSGMVRQGLTQLITTLLSLLALVCPKHQPE